MTDVYVVDGIDPSKVATISSLKNGGAGVTLNAQTYEKTAADTDASVLRFLRVPSNGTFADIEIHHDSLSGCTDVDVGYYYPTNKNGGAVIDKDALADGLSLASATFNKKAMTAVDKANMFKAHWELAGLSRDPGGFLDIALTLNTGGTATGTITVQAYEVRLGA